MIKYDDILKEIYNGLIINSVYKFIKNCYQLLHQTKFNIIFWNSLIIVF